MNSLLFLFCKTLSSSHHINPERPVFENEVRKVERHRDDAEDEVCQGQVGNQHVPGGEQDLEHGVDCDDDILFICPNHRMSICSIFGM